MRSVMMLLVFLCGCDVFSNGGIESVPVTDLSGVNRRASYLPGDDGRPVASTQPADLVDPLARPYRINPTNIVHMVYRLNPEVTAHREEMIAAQYGLEEFITNLSRFEPFARFEGDMSNFPKRRDSEGVTGEMVGGIEKETYEGAILRVEGGVSGSRVEYGEVDEDEDEVEQGSGGLVRARFEIPFVGSRKRQNRVISQAFQESTAREAELDYLSSYRRYAKNGLGYYYITLRYLNYARAYQRKLDDIEKLLAEPRCKPEDKLRLEGEAGETRVYCDNSHANYRDSLAKLLTYLGLRHDEDYTMEELPYKLSPYLKTSGTPEGLKQMIEDAYDNNPQFRVLGNAIKDAELQREQAIIGKFDITAFVEGTQFAFGAETFDDRVGGWEVGAGLSVRLNDPRVLRVTRLKAEAQIRQFRAEIDAERLEIQKDIVTECDTLRSNHKIRLQLLENVKRIEAEFNERVKRYLGGGNGGNGNVAAITIDDVLNLLSDRTSALTNLAYHNYLVWYAEIELMAATGEVYRLVGMEMGEGNGVDYVAPGQ